MEEIRNMGWRFLCALGLGAAVLLFSARPVQVHVKAGAGPSLADASTWTQLGSGEPPEALSALLRAQADAWNRGDLEGYMGGYWESESTTFAGSSGLFRGWQTLLARYRRNYPDRAAMGHLEFSGLEITPLGQDAALLLGRWQLHRQGDQPGGIFTLVVRRFREGWRIIHDHTSVVPPPGKP